MKHKRVNSHDRWRSLGLAPLPERNKRMFAYNVLQRYITGEIGPGHFEAELERSRELRHLTRDYMYQYMKKRDELIQICDRFFKVYQSICYPHNITTY